MPPEGQETIEREIEPDVRAPLARNDRPQPRERDEEDTEENERPRSVMSNRAARTAHDITARAGLPAEFARSCIDAGMTLPQFRVAFFNRLASDVPRISVRTPSQTDLNNSDALGEAIQTALYHRMAGTAPAADSPAREYMGRSMLEMGAALLHARGERVSYANRNKLADQIMTRAGGQHTTSDFPVLLQQSGNRLLLEAYKAAGSPLKAIARRRDAPDFRALSSVRLGEAPRLVKVPESGEVTHGTRGEAKETFSVVSFARIFGLSRQAIVNDDLNAFADVNRAWGRAAAETEADELVKLFTANSGNGIAMDDANPIYHTAHGNKAASGTVIDVTNLGLARKALREMKGLDGKTPIGVTPKHLVVGPAKETEAEKVLAELAASQVSEVNPFSGKLTLHVEPRFTGNAWRLFTDAAELAVLEIAYLNGADGPILDEREGWDVLGTEFRCVLDFGCGIADHRGTYLNAGN